MATSYPGGLDSFTNPGPTDFTADEIGGRTLDEFIADLADGMEAVQLWLGGLVRINTVSAAGATETLAGDTYGIHDITLTQAAYNAIPVPDPRVLYVIIG